MEIIYPITFTGLSRKKCMFTQLRSSLVGFRAVKMFQSIFLLPSCHKSKTESNKSTHHPFYKYSTSTLFAVYQVHSWEVKAIMPIKTQENVGREDLCCFAIHDRSLLIPTDSTTILFKPKETHFWVPRLPPGYQSLSCLKV